MAEPTLKLLASIVNWNNTEATNRCLSGIARLPKGRQPDVIVIDNDSRLDPLKIDAILYKSLRSLKVINNSSNLGFAGGHNPNIRLAKEGGYDYVVLLNNDTELIDTDMFLTVTTELESNPEALAAAPTILSNANPDIIWYGGGKLSFKTSYVSHLKVGETYDDKYGQEVQNVSFLTGCCLAISLKRAELDQLLLSEDYFLYWEDADWCARALKAGFKLIYVPNALLLHHVSDSLGVRSPTYIYYNIRNHLLFIHRNCSFINRPLCWIRLDTIIVKYKINILLRYKKDRLRAIIAIWKGVFDGMKNRVGATKRTL